MRRFVLIAACALLAAAGLGAQVGRRAPGFSLPDQKGVERDLADYRGRIVVLDIMRTDCPHCIAFSKTLGLLKADYGAKLEVLAIVNPPDNQQTVASFVSQYNLNGTYLFDCGQVSYSYILPDPLHGPSIAIPHAYLIDQNGIIRGDWEFSNANSDVFRGPTLRQAIDKLLESRPH